MKEEISLLRQKGLRATPGRVKILEALGKAKKPLTVPELSTCIASKSIDQVTLYRSLDAFVKTGLVQEVRLRKDCTHYEMARDHHHHVVCTECGAVEDFEGCEIEKVMGEALRQVRGFASITKHSFELFGLCTPCARAV